MPAITDLPTAALERAGLSPSEIGDWSVSASSRAQSFEAAAGALSGFLGRGIALAERLPTGPHRTDDERIAAEALAATLFAARISFLSIHTDELYGALTDGYSIPRRLET